MPRRGDVPPEPAAHPGRPRIPRRLRARAKAHLTRRAIPAAAATRPPRSMPWDAVSWSAFQRHDQSRYHAAAVTFEQFERGGGVIAGAQLRADVGESSTFAHAEPESGAVVFHAHFQPLHGTLASDARCQ